MKDKWIVKLKVSNTLLKDLIPSYRQSLPGLGASNDRYVVYFDALMTSLSNSRRSYSEYFVRPESWSFGNEEEDEAAFDNATVHPISTPLPRSLKGLFDDFGTPTNQPYCDDNYKTLVIPTSLRTTVSDSHPPSPRPPSSTTYAPIPISAPLATTDQPTTPHSPLPPSTNFTSNNVLPEEHLSSAGNSSSSTLAPIPLDIPPTIQTRRSPISSSSPEASSSDSSQVLPPPGPSTRSLHFNNDPPSSSASSAFKATHRMQTITGKNIRRDDPSGPSWKFPAAPISTSNSRGSETANVGLGLVCLQIHLSG